jgi:hypothetical protein
VRKPVKSHERRLGLASLNKSLQRFMRRQHPEYGKTWVRRLRKGKWCLVAFKRIRMSNGVAIRIRLESNHKLPHFHIEYKTEYQASYRLPDCIKLAGHMPKRRESEMLEWAKKNSGKLMTEWKLINHA